MNKFITARTILATAAAAMLVTVIIGVILSACKVESAILTNAFEVFKLITAVVLGYLFGSNGK